MDTQTTALPDPAGLRFATPDDVVLADDARAAGLTTWIARARAEGHGTAEFFRAELHLVLDSDGHRHCGTARIGTALFDVYLSDNPSQLYAERVDDSAARILLGLGDDAIVTAIRKAYVRWRFAQARHHRIMPLAAVLADERFAALDVPRDQWERVIGRLALTEGVHVRGEADQKRLTDEDRAAAVVLGGTARHNITYTEEYVLTSEGQHILDEARADVVEAPVDQDDEPTGSWFVPDDAHRQRVADAVAQAAGGTVTLTLTDDEARALHGVALAGYRQVRDDSPRSWCNQVIAVLDVLDKAAEAAAAAREREQQRTWRFVERARPVLDDLALPSTTTELYAVFGAVDALAALPNDLPDDYAVGALVVRLAKLGSQDLATLGEDHARYRAAAEQLLAIHKDTAQDDR